jgi:hypothetical protein
MASTSSSSSVPGHRANDLVSRRAPLEAGAPACNGFATGSLWSVAGEQTVFCREQPAGDFLRRLDDARVVHPDPADGIRQHYRHPSLLGPFGRHGVRLTRQVTVGSPSIGLLARTRGDPTCRAVAAV